MAAVFTKRRSQSAGRRSNYTARQKTEIVLSALAKQTTIAEVCWRQGLLRPGRSDILQLLAKLLTGVATLACVSLPRLGQSLLGFPNLPSQAFLARQRARELFAEPGGHRKTREETKAVGIRYGRIQDETAGHWRPRDAQGSGQ